MTATHLYRGNDKGEILDSEGKVVGRIVPVEPTKEMLNSSRMYNAPYKKWAAALSAAPADWSSVAVRVPEPQIDKRIFDTEDQKAAWTDGWLSAIFALDAIKGAT